MRIQLGIGTGTQTVEVPDRCVQQVLEPNPVPHGLTGEAEVRRALAEPIGTPRLREIVHPGESIAIITSDITRPMPTWTVMPPLLEELYAAGVQPEDITLVFALGSHRKHTEEEMRHLAGERAFREIRCVDGDPNDCVHPGVTSRGTPVDIDRRVAEADRRICLGNIEYHYFAGYSGGAKAIMPGVSTRAAIQSNHSRMVEADARAGKLAGNPVREDLEEAATMVGVDFILNVVLDAHKEIIRAVAGDVTAAHRAGCAFLDGQELHLTPSEYKLLCLLCKNVGKVLTHTYITQQIWGRSWDNDVASLRVFMATLRKKLEKEPGSPQYIQTHIGVGYRMMKVEPCEKNDNGEN